MKINAVRFLNVAFLLLIITCKQYALLYYVSFSHLSLEFLNSRKLYLQQNFRLYNFVFFSYELVLLERLRKFKFNPTIEWFINNVEHILFGLVICLMIYIYFIVLFKKKENTSWKRILSVWLVFNFIGFINEFFQNAISHRAIYILIPDSIKDIGMNLIGSTLFLMIAIRKNALSASGN